MEHHGEESPKSLELVIKSSNLLSSLQNLLSVNTEKYSQCLKALPHSLKCSDGLTAELRFHYVLLDGDGEPKFQQLAKHLVHSIITYCFGAKKRDNLNAAEAAQLYTQARDLFRKYNRDGQAGEVLIYFLLETVLAAPQILQKMPISTNTGDERKGSDGLHAKWNPELKVLDIFFAESKLHNSFGNALTEAFQSMEKMHATPMISHELFMAAHNMHALGTDLQDELLSFLNGETGTKIRTNHACLIGFDWDQYQCLDDSRRQAFLAEFETRYLKDANKVRDQIVKKLEDCGIKHLRFEFFVIPFKKVQDFRDWFLAALLG